MPAVRKIKSRQPKPRSSYRRKGDPWTQAELKRLGKTVDSALARRRRRTIKETVAEREARRLALPTGPRRWTAREIRMLGASPIRSWDADSDVILPDREIARRTGWSWQGVANRRLRLGIHYYAASTQPWTSAEDELLGTASDKVLAKRLNRSPDTVLSRRLKLRIASGNPDYQRWTESEDRVLRQCSRAEAAHRLGRSLSSVQHRRHRLGLK